MPCKKEDMTMNLKDSWRYWLAPGLIMLILVITALLQQ